MKEVNYTVKKLSEELGEERQNIRRRLIKLNIRAINEDKRSYKNEPLEYDGHALVQLAEEYGVTLSNTNDKDSITKSNTNETHNNIEKSDKDELIEILKEQLYESNKSRENLEKLLNQQQQLSQGDRNKIEILELELKGTQKGTIKKKIWKRIFNR